MEQTMVVGQKATVDQKRSWNKCVWSSVPFERSWNQSELESNPKIERDVYIEEQFYYNRDALLESPLSGDIDRSTMTYPE